jgi:hypothetical protein
LKLGQIRGAPPTLGNIRRQASAACHTEAGTIPARVTDSSVLLVYLPPIENW